MSEAHPAGIPSIVLSGIVLDSVDARALAAFYHHLLGWEIVQDEPDWVSLQGPDAGTRLSFQTEPEYQPPSWPTDGSHQQMMLHLDFRVTDLPEAYAHAISVGATPASWQPQNSVWVFLDPAGHPFCLSTD